MPNPAFVGLMVLGLICGVLTFAYFLAGNYVGWTLAVVTLFVFAGAAGATLSLKTAGVLAAIGVLLLILSTVVKLPV